VKDTILCNLFWTKQNVAEEISQEGYTDGTVASMRELNLWFEKNKRSFPWRDDPTPYKVWISEVMLQQTRATAVVPYFERWISRFPDVKALAIAPLELVMKMWEGLGYYSRARNLHKGAQLIVGEFGGEIPKTRYELESIPGLGPYTASAILSFGHKRRAAAIDGNVTRVLARYLRLEENVAKASAKRKIQEAADALLDLEEPWVTVEALIELGATLCTVKPRCESCPLENSCLGKEIAPSLPVKNPPAAITRINRAVLLIEMGSKMLLKKGDKGKIMADLYEFPYFEMGRAVWSWGKVRKTIRTTFQMDVRFVEQLQGVFHSFTRFQAALTPFRLALDVEKEVEGYLWVEKTALSSLPFSSGHRRLLSILTRCA